ncbi:senescence marker protein-30 [Rhizodiscina lignyota]|uniref:Senescence marker protein-30 n=1 Tax=Rhizodiscina lignyota TaxID=1504668 RepID=A0A9P4IE09_9PEZI|nr:senescence marker protein-30 [Rhizodiscina lignyota]
MATATFPPISQPESIVAEKFTEVPHEHRRNKISLFSHSHNKGKIMDSFLEGPIMVNGKLFVTDIAHGRIFAIDLATKEWTCFIEYDGQPNGMAYHPKRKLILIADRKKGVLSLDPETKFLDTILDSFNGQPFLGPNDLVVGGDGAIYFTDQGMTGLHEPVGRVFRHDPETGKTDVLLRNGPSPNGLMFDKEEGVLFVGMTRDNSVWHVPIFPDGTTQRAGRFSSYYGLGGPDGMTLDCDGNLFICVVRIGTIFVHKPDGTPLARIVMPEGVGVMGTNLTWSPNTDGGEGEGDTLYITESASGTVLSVKWHTKGWLGKIYYEK